MKRAEREAILARYPDPSPLRRLYRRLRLARGDYDAVEAEVGRGGLVLDLGAGEGLLAHVLVTRAPARRVLAVDHDPRRVARLRRSAAGLPIEALSADFAACDLPPCDAVLLVDVLHYLDRATQERLLTRVRDALRPGGVLLLRDPDAGAGLAFAWNRLHERVFTLLRLTQGSIRGYRTSEAWASLLGHLGYAAVEVARRHRLSLYADRVVVARRPP